MQTIFPKGQQIISQLPHSAGLTPNQKKKRRQKLSKLYKRKQNSAERSQLADVHPAEATPASPTFIAPTDSIAVDTAEGPDRRAEFSHSHGSVCAAPAGAAPDQPLLKRPRRASSQEDAGLATAYNLAAPSESAASADAGAAHREPSGATEPAPLILEGKNGKRVFVYGNYHRYYGYRLGQSFSMDPRLALFERSWFANKRCMDVGCNEGLVTLAIVTRFGSRSMVGVDIDEHLVKKACRNLREERSAATVRSATARQGGVPAAERRAARSALASLAQTWFVHADFLDARADEGSVDCLTALSVTKWVHLHRGDAGLRAFFARVRVLLSNGGLFILEPQPWRSYKAAAMKMRKQGGDPVALPEATYFQRPDELELRPEAFPELLCQEFGFVLLRRLAPPEETTAGFDRHMYVFKKVT